MAAAAEALSEEILPFIGMLTRKSHFSRTSLVIPSPSLPMTMAAGKPGTRGFQEAMARSGVGAGETAMLGDKLLTDTLGARRSGVLMLMVEPKGGPDGAWNHVLHALQEPFKAASAHDERKKR